MAQVGPAQVGPGQHGAHQRGPLQIGPGQVRPCLLYTSSLFQDVYLQPGSYRMTLNFFPDIVAQYYPCLLYTSRCV